MSQLTAMTASFCAGASTDRDGRGAVSGRSCWRNTCMWTYRLMSVVTALWRMSSINPPRISVSATDGGHAREPRRTSAILAVSFH
ncbi:hypothetical protein [Escherichia coli]|uniref:hypothetical protein n=1 Tax=Escherichia coli TaxID=562 RepID=UPI00388EC0B9